jgi:hypothetical protein
VNLWLAQNSGPKLKVSKMFLMAESWGVQEAGIHGMPELLGLVRELAWVVRCRMPELLGLVRELAWVVEDADDCSSRYCLASPL